MRLRVHVCMCIAAGANDNFANAVHVSGAALRLPAVFVQSTEGATHESGAQAGTGASTSVWYQFQSARAGTYEVRVAECNRLCGVASVF